MPFVYKDFCIVKLWIEEINKQTNKKNPWRKLNFSPVFLRCQCSTSLLLELSNLHLFEMQISGGNSYQKEGGRKKEGSLGKWVKEKILTHFTDVK